MAGSMSGHCQLLVAGSKTNVSFRGLRPPPSLQQSVSQNGFLPKRCHEKARRLWAFSKVLLTDEMLSTCCESSQLRSSQDSPRIRLSQD